MNTIYWCTDDPTRRKSYDDGVPVTVGGGIEGDLLLIPEPPGIRWTDRLLPRLESGELSGGDMATPYRVKRRIELTPRIGVDTFINLYAHGAQEPNSSVLLHGGLESVFDLLVAGAKRRNCEVYFVSAWQMHLAIYAIRERRDPVVAARVARIEEVGAGSSRK